MNDTPNPDEENVNANQWYQWLAQAQRYEYNWRTRKAIAAIKPRKKKPSLQMQGVPALDMPPSNPGNPSHGDLP